MAKPRLITRESELADLARQLKSCPRVALDLESNGMHAYRATACVIQIAVGEDAGEGDKPCDPEVFLIDACKASLLPLGDLLASTETEKIVHDVTFDARILAEAGVVLSNVRDTSIAAGMAGRPATGLGSLLASELGIKLDKSLQNHDWRARPLTQAMVDYLAGDVIYLATLADRLFDDVAKQGIEAEVEEETRYRLGRAIEGAQTRDPRPPYVRLKGIDRASEVDRAILRHLAAVREKLAEALDVPPYKVLGPDTLFEIAKTKPQDLEALARIRGAMSGKRARSIARDVLKAVTQGLEEGEVPLSDRPWFEDQTPPKDVLQAQKKREKALTRWRQREAKTREVHEQAVLPGHCLRSLAALETFSPECVAAIDGIGSFRVARDFEAWLAALSAPAALVTAEPAA